MTVSKSILNEVELEDGSTVYVQVNGRRGSISFDGPHAQYSHWLTLDELEKLAAQITQSLKEAKSE